ncbi:MAG: hypothetical protein RSB29_06030 [Alistipes sp.]
MSENQTNKSEVREDYDSLIERMPEMEQEMGVRLESLSAVYNPERKALSIFCEVYPTKGQCLKNNISILAVIYDLKQRIIGKESYYLLESEFKRFNVCELSFFDLTPRKMAQISRIKVFPTQL